MERRLMAAAAVVGVMAGMALGDGATSFDSELEGWTAEGLPPELQPPHPASDYTVGGITFFDVDYPFNQNPLAVTPVWPVDGPLPDFPGESAEGEPFPIWTFETGPTGQSGVEGYFYLDFRTHGTMVENADALVEDFDGAFTRPNLLIVGSGFYPGDNFNLSLMTSLKMTTGEVERYARFDAIYMDGDAGVWADVWVTLDALREGVVVATDEFQIGWSGDGRLHLSAREMSISGVEFDTLHLYCHKQGVVTPGDVFTRACVMLDNIEIRSQPPCAADIDGTPGVDVFDLLAYLDLWFSGDAAADKDGVAGIDVFDLLGYLDGWFAGC